MQGCFHRRSKLDNANLSEVKNMPITKEEAKERGAIVD
jgi:hypothetical protein